MSIKRFNTIILFLLICNLSKSQEKSYSNDEYILIISYSTDRIKEDSIKNSKYYKSRAEAYYALNKYNEALMDLNTYLKINHNDGYAYYNRAILKDMKNEYVSAIEDFSSAIKYSNDELILSDIYFARGSTYEKLDNVRNAILDYKNSIKFNNENDEAYNNLGLIFIKLKKYTTALEYLNLALEINRNRVNSLYSRALVFIELENLESAIADLDEALTISKDNPYANNYMGYLLYKKGEIDEACEYFKKAIDSGLTPLVKEINCE